MTTNTHHTKLKGDIAVAAVIFDLTKKGYIVSEPMSENAPYDLICDTGNDLLKIQVKCRRDGIIPHSTNWSDKSGCHQNKINTSKIDYFALVNEDYTKICYPKSDLVGKSFNWTVPLIYQEYYYWEDYKEFKSERIKRKNKHDIVSENRQPSSRPEKIIWISDEDLKTLLWEKPTSEVALQLGVTDSAIGKRCKARGIEKPPRGYWTKTRVLSITL